MALRFVVAPPVTDELRESVVQLWTEVASAGGAVAYAVRPAARRVRRRQADRDAVPGEPPWRIDRALPVFIGDREPDGLSSVFEVGDPAYERAVDLILEARR
jgi:hypothetical protein